MSDINLGVSVEGQANAVQQLQQITQAQAQVGTTAEVANRRAATSATQATSALTTMAQSSQQTAQRIQGVAGSIQSLVSALGSGDRTAGLIGSVAGATAQFAAMGSLLGPAGTVAGAIIGLTTGLISVARASEDAGSGISAMGLHASTAEERVRNLNEALEAMARNSRLDMGVASMAEYDREIAGVEARLENLNIAFRNMDSTLAGSRSERSLTAEIRREAARLEELRGLRGSAATEEADVMMEDLMSSGGGTAPTRRGGRGESRASREAREWRDLLGAINDTAESGLAIIEETRAAAEALDALNTQAGGQGGGRADRRDGFRAGQDARSPVGATSMFAEQAEAAREFERGYVSSIDAVISAYDHLRDTSVAAANDVVRSGRFMERGMVAVGNNITEVVGGRMMGAFESALGAWLDGSKSFVEAAEAMAKGVIRSLVQEGIVQAVTETARGIADLASYQYATAGMHFAAAAAWGAVAGVAGAVGAATGSFGGSGAGAGGGPSQREMAERDRRDDRSAGTTVINLYPGAFSTEDERANALRRALNFNARMGRRIDRRLVA